jgi:hypothetical protein
MYGYFASLCIFCEWGMEIMHGKMNEETTEIDFARPAAIDAIKMQAEVTTQDHKPQ